MFLKRAGNYANVFDKSIGFIRGRTADGKWISPFDPQEPYYNFMMKEASGWSTLWLAPHDVQGLIGLLGGRDKFRSEEHTSELQSLMRISYAVFCLKKKTSRRNTPKHASHIISHNTHYNTHQEKH